MLVDANLNPVGSSMTVILNTAETANSSYDGPHPVRSQISVQRKHDGTAYVEIQPIPGAEFLILTNHP